MSDNDPASTSSGDIRPDPDPGTPGATRPGGRRPTAAESGSGSGVTSAETGEAAAGADTSGISSADPGGDAAGADSTPGERGSGSGPGATSAETVGGSDPTAGGSGSGSGAGGATSAGTVGGSDPTAGGSGSGSGAGGSATAEAIGDPGPAEGGTGADPAAAGSGSGSDVRGRVGDERGSGTGELAEGLDTTVDEIAEEREAATSPGWAIRSRFTGLIALVLGIIGMLASLVLAFLVLRTGFGVSSAVDSLLDPVADSLARVETRIDQADDTVDRDGVPADVMPELRARSEGLLDVATSGVDLAVTVTDHPIYRWLPAEVDPLRSSMEEFETGATRVEEIVTSPADDRALNATGATAVADELDGMQAGVAGAGEALDEATRSLRRWIRIGAVIGLLTALWSCWAQFSLVRRGARSLRGRPI